MIRINFYGLNRDILLGSATFQNLPTTQTICTLGEELEAKFIEFIQL